MKVERVTFLKGVTFDHDEAEISLTTEGAASLVDEPYLLKSLKTKEETKEMKNAKVLKVLKGLIEDVDSLQELEVAIEEAIEEAVEDVEAKTAELEAKVEELEAVVEEKELAEKLKVAKGMLDGFGLGEELIDKLSSLGEEALVLIVEALTAVKNASVEVEKEGDNEEEDENDIAKSLSQEFGHLQKQRVTQAGSLLARVQKLKSKKA